MGVDSRLFISKRWSVEDVSDVLQKRLSAKVVVKPTTVSPDYTQLILIFPNQTDKRMLSVHTHYEQAGFQGTLLTLRSNDQAIGIMTALAKTFGGFMQAQDTSEDYECFNTPDSGEMGFLLKEALKENPEIGTDQEKFIEWLKNRHSL